MTQTDFTIADAINELEKRRLSDYDSKIAFNKDVEEVLSRLEHAPAIEARLERARRPSLLSAYPNYAGDLNLAYALTENKPFDLSIHWFDGQISAYEVEMWHSKGTQQTPAAALTIAALRTLDALVRVDADTGSEGAG